jgi:phage terminase small subunit
MKKARREAILAKVKTATKEVSDAAKDLAKLLSELDAAPRAQKTTVSKVVQAAFARLKTARVALLDIEKILKDDD